jgi:glucokinase
MQYALGIDIGGTKISIVLGTSDGKILVRKKVLTQTGSRSKACFKEVMKNIEALLREVKIPSQKLLGIGVGAPGAVNSKKGILPRSPNLPGWEGIPVCRILEKKFKLPVRLANDANAAALGEHLFGAGKKTKDLIYITVSTGVGGGIVINGQIHEGAGFVAGEVGHISVVPEGQRCKCGHRGCLEAYASGTAIGRSYRQMTGKKIAGAKEVGEAAASGDRLAIKSYREAAYYLGIGLANFMNILNPEAIVIGGGVLKSSPPVYWQEVIRSAKDHAWPEAFRTTRVLQSPLLGHSGDFGALALAFQYLRRRR